MNTQVSAAQHLSAASQRVLQLLLQTQRLSGPLTLA